LPTVGLSSVKLTASSEVVLDWLLAGSSALPVVISNETVGDCNPASDKAVKRTKIKAY
jgi:hypothetical protein